MQTIACIRIRLNDWSPFPRGIMSSALESITHILTTQMMVVQNWDNIVIAYAPAGVVATPVEAQEAHAAVRGLGGGRC